MKTFNTLAMVTLLALGTTAVSAAPLTLTNAQLDTVDAAGWGGWGGGWGSSSASSGAAVITPGSAAIAAGGASSSGNGGTAAGSESGAAAIGSGNFWGAGGAGIAGSRSYACSGRGCR